MVNSISNFDELPNSAHVRQVTVERLFSCAPATVWRWVHKGVLPKPKKIEGITLWNVLDLRKTLAELSNK